MAIDLGSVTYALIVYNYPINIYIFYLEKHNWIVSIYLFDGKITKSSLKIKVRKVICWNPLFIIHFVRNNRSIKTRTNQQTNNPRSERPIRDFDSVVPTCIYRTDFSDFYTVPRSIDRSKLLVFDFDYGKTRNQRVRDHLRFHR